MVIAMPSFNRMSWDYIQSTSFFLRARDWLVLAEAKMNEENRNDQVFLHIPSLLFPNLAPKSDKIIPNTSKDSNFS